MTRQWHGIAIDAWDEMDGDRQAYYVAVYRAKFHMDAIVAQDQAAEAKARSKPGGKYGRKG